MTEYRERLARRVAQMRGDIPMRQYAEKLGVSKSMLHRLEAGEQNITLDSLEALCKRMGVDIAEVFAQD